MKEYIPPSLSFYTTTEYIYCIVHETDTSRAANFSNWQFNARIYIDRTNRTKIKKKLKEKRKLGKDGKGLLISLFSFMGKQAHETRTVWHHMLLLHYVDNMEMDNFNNSIQSVSYKTETFTGAEKRISTCLEISGKF
jgi:hypothetical protein